MVVEILFYVYFELIVIFYEKNKHDRFKLKAKIESTRLKLISSISCSLSHHLKQTFQFVVVYIVYIIYSVIIVRWIFILMASLCIGIYFALGKSDNLEGSSKLGWMMQRLPTLRNLQLLIKYHQFMILDYFNKSSYQILLLDHLLPY